MCTSMPSMHRLLSKAWRKRIPLFLLLILWLVGFQIVFYVSSSSFSLHFNKNSAVGIAALNLGDGRDAVKSAKMSDEATKRRTPGDSQRNHHQLQISQAVGLSSTSHRDSSNRAAKFISDDLKSGFAVIDSRAGEQVRLSEDVQFVLFIPHAIQESTGAMDAFSQDDQRSIRHLVQLLEASPDYDAATCLPEGMKGFLYQEFNSTWCRFASRQSTLIIRNTGPWFPVNKYSRSFSANASFQCCNIVKGPFLIRKEKFMSLGWKSNYGKASILDFFLRSRGTLRITRLNDCILSDSLSVIDRGTQENTHDFPDYSQFGNEHGILRIVMEDRVEWTKCVADGKLCSERPFSPPKTLPQVGMPLCCSVALDRMLRDSVWALNKVGMRYRLIYGTLLGSVRNKAIIPWTHDIDIAIDRPLLRNGSWNIKLQEVLHGRYYVGISFMETPRMIPLIPVYISVNNTSFFNGTDDLFGNSFFSEDIVTAMNRIHTGGTYWRERGYVDFYESPEIWWNGSSIITINGANYISIREIDYELANWYGRDYMRPALSGSWNGLSDANG